MWMGDALGEESVIKTMRWIHSNRAQSEGMIIIAGNADGLIYAMTGKLGRWNESSIEQRRWAIISISAVTSAVSRVLLGKRWLWLTLTQECPKRSPSFPRFFHDYQGHWLVSPQTAPGCPTFISIVMHRPEVVPRFSVTKVRSPKKPQVAQNLPEFLGSSQVSPIAPKIFWTHIAAERGWGMLLCLFPFDWNSFESI